MGVPRETRVTSRLELELGWMLRLLPPHPAVRLGVKMVASDCSIGILPPSTGPLPTTAKEPELLTADWQRASSGLGVPN